jgi:hypothetical protein
MKEKEDDKGLVDRVDKMIANDPEIVKEIMDR